MTRVLIVEDDRTIVKTLSDFLTEEGFSCVTAEGQRTALEKFAEEDFDLVLLDVSLADGSGAAPSTPGAPDSRTATMPARADSLVLTLDIRF